MITTACHHDQHQQCPTCACGCHWLMPLAHGQADQAVAPSGRTWVRADTPSVQAGSHDHHPAR